MLVKCKRKFFWQPLNRAVYNCVLQYTIYMRWEARVDKVTRLMDG